MISPALFNAFIEDVVMTLEKEDRPRIRCLFSGKCALPCFPRLKSEAKNWLLALKAVSDLVVQEGPLYWDDDLLYGGHRLFDHTRLSVAERKSIFMIANFPLKDVAVAEVDKTQDEKDFIERQYETATHIDLFRLDDLRDLRCAMHILLGERPKNVRMSLRHGPGLTAEGLRMCDKNIATISRSLKDTEWYRDIRDEWLTVSDTAAERTEIRFVPKDFRRSRVIGMEPVWRMAAQLSLKGELERALWTWVPFQSQERHRRNMSRSYDYTLTTVDLSEASDRISYDLAQAILPSSWFRALDAARTKEYQTKNGTGKTHSFALMGNGFCFPVLSAVCLAMAFVACCRAIGMPVSRQSFRWLQQCCGVSTFGDDLLVPEIALPSLRSLLSYQGLKMNNEKSGNGVFRECCGLYEFLGLPPFELLRLKNSGSDAAATLHLIALQNRLFSAGFFKSAEVLLHETRAPQTSYYGVEGVACFVADDSELDPSCGSKIRWSKTYQRLEFRGVRPKTVGRPVHLADGAGVMGFLTRSLRETEVFTTRGLAAGWYPCC